MYKQNLKKLLKNDSKLTLGIFVAAGIFLGIAFTHAFLWWLAIFGIALSIQAVYASKSIKQLSIGTALMGFVHYAIAISWFWSVYPLDDFAISTTMSFLVILILWVGCALSMGIAKLLVTLPLYLSKNSAFKVYVLYLTPVLWILSDMLGAFLFSVFSYGSGSTLNANFSFGWVGYLLADHGLFSVLASWGGVFALTFCYVALVVLLYTVAVGKHKKKWLLLGVIFIVILISSRVSGLEKQHDETLRVAALETTLPSVRGVSAEDMPAYHNELMQQVTAAVQSGVAYVILPEGARMTGVFVSPEEALGYIANIAPGDVVVVDSGWYENSENKMYVRAFIYDTKTMSIYEMDKKYLVPQGEFVSYVTAGLITFVGFGDAIRKFRNMFDYVPGELSDNPSWPDYLPGVMFCFESVDPWGVRKAAEYRDVPFVAHPVSHAWFNKPFVLWNEIDQMLKVNSTFANMTVYQASNMYEAKRY